MYSIYVNVITLMKSTGEKVPKAIIWEDGKEYKIDSYKREGNYISQSGKSGILYKIKLGSNERNLYYDSLHNRWFMDLK